jgi:hypothetical protein
MDIMYKISGEFDASKLIQRLDDLKLQTQSNHWFFTTPPVTIGFIILAISIAIAVWRKCYTTASATTTPTTLPLSQLPHLHH